jgi:CRP/FNR family transcriptional regulator
MKHQLIYNAFPLLESELKEDLEKYGVIRLYKKGEMIVKMGQPLIHCFSVLQGSVRACRESEKGSECLVAFLKEGESFAMSVCEDSSPETKKSFVTLFAIKPTYILNLSFNNKDLLAKKYDGWYKYILSTTVMYYGFYLKVIENIAFKKLGIRIEFFLERLSEITRKRILDTSHREIAKSLHCSREAVSRQLKNLEDSGRIKLGRNQIELVNF